MNHVQVVSHLQIPTLTKLFTCGKPVMIIQICKMPGKQNIISYISEHYFINFFVVSKSSNQHPYKIEIKFLVRFEVIQISSFSEC